MRVSWSLFAALLVVVVAQVLASPYQYEDFTDETPTNSGSKTWHAVKNFFSPVSDYFRGLPSKTPSDVATDVKEKVTDIKEWAQENESIQALIGSLAPVKVWLKEKANDLQDQTFREMYNNVKERVLVLDEKIATWIQEHNKE